MHLQLSTTGEGRTGRRSLISDMARSHLPVEPSADLAAAPVRSWPGASIARVFLGTPYRPRRVTVLLVALAIMSGFDLLLTLTYLTQSGMMESNPIARVVMVGGGTGGVVLWKVLTVALATFIFFVARARLSGELGALLCCTVLGWLMVRWHHYTAEAHTITSVINQDFRTDVFGWVSHADAPPVDTRRAPLGPIVLRSETWDEP